MRLKRVVYFLALVMLANFVYSQSGLTVSPPRTYFTLNPGEVEQKKIKIINPSATETLELAISFNDWKYNEFGSNIILDPNSLPNSLANWITVFPSNVLTLKPKEEKEIDVQLKVPATINQEDVHTVMMYVTQTNSVNREYKNGETLIIMLQTGVKIYHRLNIGRNLDIEFIDFNFEKDKNRLVLELENTGNVWAEGVINNELINQETGEVIKLEEQVFYSLPKDKRTLFIQLPNDLPKSEYLVTSTFDLGDKDAIKVAELNFSNEN